MVTARTDCPVCHARTIEARIGGGLKLTLNWDEDPEGTVAAYQLSTGAWAARYMLPGEPLSAPWKAFTRHWDTSPGCAPQAAERQRDAAKAVRSAIAEHKKAQRRQRGKRPQPQITGIRIPPP